MPTRYSWVAGVAPSPSDSLPDSWSPGRAGGWTSARLRPHPPYAPRRRSGQMEFYPADTPVPEGLRTAEFLLRPLRPADNALDYEAVMATQETLRLGGDWPRPDFTPEENRADLAGHEADFSARPGFTYTVLEPDETRCLGCVYIYPRDRVLQSLGADDAAIAAGGDHDAVAWFWVRPDGVARELDRRLLAALLPWL